MTNRDAHHGEESPALPDMGTGPAWSIGDRIRKARREANLSQQQLADAIGVGDRALSSWEAGRTKPEDSAAVAHAVAAVTGVNAGWILGDPQAEKRGAA